MSWTRGVVRLSKLDGKQKRLLRRIRDKWKNIAGCTAPAERAAAEEGARRLYYDFGLPHPTEFVWARTLREAHKISRILFEQHLPDSSVRHIYNAGFHARTMAIRYATPEFFDFVDRELSQIHNPWSFSALLSASSHDQRPVANNEVRYGQDHASGMAFAEFTATALRVPYCQKLYGLMQAVASCGFVWFTPSTVILFERPLVLRFDDRFRPHCSDGPAIQYRDGLIIHALHGVSVPRKYVETAAEQIDLGELLREPNAEVRMAVLSKCGFDRLLDEGLSVLKPKTISRANGNALLEINLGEDWRHRVIKARFLYLTWRDKIGPKQTVIPVPHRRWDFGDSCPDDINDCEQVRRWTLGWPKDVSIVAET